VDSEPTQPKPTKTTFVYDQQTGKVVHIHQFIPAGPDGTCSDQEMEETALNLAPAAWKRAHLAVLHHDRELDLDPNARYRVDIGKRQLVVEPAPKKPSQDRLQKPRPRKPGPG
jgi:hypothetical protein